LIALAGCVTPEATAEHQSELASYTAGRVAGQPRRCIPITSQSEGLRAVDGQTLVYRSGNTNWVNRLQHDCPGLRPLATLIVDSIGNRYCSGDPVRPIEAGSRTARSVCVLGAFTPFRRQG
jgi:hypothetical protein